MDGRTCYHCCYRGEYPADGASTSTAARRESQLGPLDNVGGIAQDVPEMGPAAQRMAAFWEEALTAFLAGAPLANDELRDRSNPRDMATGV